MTDLSTLSDQQLLALLAHVSGPARPAPQQALSPAPGAPAPPRQASAPQQALMTAAAAPANAIDPAIVRAELQRSAANSGQLAADTIRQHMAAILANPALRQRYAADELAQMERMRDGVVGAGSPAPPPAAPRASFWDLLPLAGAGLLPPRQPPVPGRR